MPRRSSRRSSSKRAGSSVSGEVQKLFRAGDQVDTALLMQLRNRYGDEELADRVRDAFVQRHSMVVRGAKKFAQAIRSRYASSNIPYHQLLMKAQLHARKHGLSQAEFAEFQRMYEQELAGTSRANEVVLPLTTMIKVLGNLSGDGRSSGVSISENDYRNLQEILKLHEASRPLHSQVVIQNLGYNDTQFQTIVTKGTLSKARHNPGEHVHPVVAALFGPSIPVVQNHFLYSNLSGIIKNLYNREALRTRPDYELYYNLITDPNDVVCDNRTPVGDLLQRCNLQNQLWNAVLHLRNGQHYNSSFREFMTAVDVCRLNKHDSPDLVYGRHDGTVFKRLVNAFSFRPTVVATVPVHTVFANNPYAQNVRPTITNIPMINVRLISFQSVSPVAMQAGTLTGGTPNTGPVNLQNAVNQVQTFIEGNMLVNRATNVISSRQVLFFYVDRRAHVMNVGMRHFNLNNLPKSVAGLERTNEKEVTVPPMLTIGSNNTQFHLRSAVCVKTTPYSNVIGTSNVDRQALSGISLVTGSEAVVMKNNTATNPFALGSPDITGAAPNSNQYVYDPVGPITNTDEAENPNVKCWSETNVANRLKTRATILVYQSNETDEMRSFLAV
tara:strand:+ start:171 stop:2006 length:1836 start_codon:yes stop_codon:yes gene_type:complete